MLGGLVRSPSRQTDTAGSLTSSRAEQNNLLSKQKTAGKTPPQLPPGLQSPTHQDTAQLASGPWEIALSQPWPRRQRCCGLRRQRPPFPRDRPAGGYSETNRRNVQKPPRHNTSLFQSSPETLSTAKHFPAAPEIFPPSGSAQISPFSQDLKTSLRHSTAIRKSLPTNGKSSWVKVQLLLSFSPANSPKHQIKLT